MLGKQCKRISSSFTQTEPLKMGAKHLFYKIQHFILVALTIKAKCTDYHQIINGSDNKGIIVSF